MKRYKVVQDARGHWGILDTHHQDFASWGYPGDPGDSGAEDVYYIIEYASILNSGQSTKENFDWDGYLPREEA